MVINETKGASQTAYANNVIGVEGIELREVIGTDGTVERGRLVKNIHGDTIAVVGGNEYLAQYEYDAFGKCETESESGFENPIRYSGEYWDEESDMLYLRARYYDSDLRRFISEDPARDGMNWYAYCGNNPLIHWDPSGLEMAGDEQYSWLKQTMLHYLGTTWTISTEQWERDRIHETANSLRNFDDNSFNRAIYLNDSDGALEQGHAGLLLLNSLGEGLLFSYYPTNESLPEVMNVDAEMRFDVLSSERVNNLLYGNGQVGSVTASDGDIIFSENYDRFIYFDISNSAGINMFNAGAWIYANPGTYRLLGNQCDNIVDQIMTAGGYGYDVQWRPNNTYEYLAGNHASWSL